MAPRIEFYTRSHCPYCHRAKALLQRKGAAFEEISLDEKPDLVDEVVRRSGRMTVPQVFVDGVALGGSDELHSLEAEGRLDAILAGGKADDSAT